MRTAVVTDSNSGIFPDEGRRLGVYVVPMPVLLEGRSYTEGVDLTHDALFRALSEHRQASTSQPAPADVMAVWDTALADGYDELVYLPMSSGLSNSCQTAKILADEYGGRVEVADDRRISITLRHAVEDALALRARGWSARAIREELERTADNSLVYVGVDTLEYLKRNGRVTPAGAALGSLLSIKPLLVIRGERLDAYAKVRGRRCCQEREVAAMAEYADTLRRAGHTIRVSAAGSFADPADTERWLGMVRAAFPGVRVDYDPLTFSICCHVGPNAFGMGVSAVAGEE